MANYPNNIASLMSGVSGLVWMPLINCWGSDAGVVLEHSPGHAFPPWCTLDAKLQHQFRNEGALSPQRQCRPDDRLDICEGLLFLPRARTQDWYLDYHICMCPFPVPDAG